MQVGQIARFSQVFRDGNGNLADPTSVTFAYSYVDATGSEHTEGTLTYTGTPATPTPGLGTICRVSIGYYFANLDTTGKVGAWTAIWTASGNVQTASTTTLLVTSATLDPSTLSTFTVGYLVDRTMSMLMGTFRDQQGMLSADIGPTTTTVMLKYATGIGQGSILSIDDELMYCWLVASSSTGFTCLVERGYHSSNPASHSAGAVGLINPQFSKHDIRENLRDEIRSWPPQLFRVKTLEITTVDLVNGYDLGILTDWLFPLDCRISPGYADQLAVNSLEWPRLRFEVIRSAPTAKFPSGNALQVTSPGGIYDTPRTIHFIYAATFNVDLVFDDDTSLVDTVGIDPSDIDVAIYGVLWRLTQGQEIRRNLFNPMGSSGDPQANPPGSILREAQFYQQTRNARYGDAQVRLRSKYPVIRR